jgi:hypothetical protein
VDCRQEGDHFFRIYYDGIAGTNVKQKTVAKHLKILEVRRV